MFRNFGHSSARRVNRKGARQAWGKGHTIRRSRLTGMELMEDRRVLAVSNFSENFDAAVVPALPAGWTASGTVAWTTSAAASASAPNSAFVPNPAFVSDNILETPVIAVVRPQAQLSFQHQFNFENSFGDGGVLEIKIGAGAYTDIVTAGGVFTAGAYTGSTSGTLGNPLGTRPAWVNDSVGFITTTVNLPASAAGQNVQFRWREGTDSSVPDTGWFVDNVTLTGVLPPAGNVVIDANDDPAPGSQAGDGVADTFDVVVSGANVTVSVNGTPVFVSPIAAVTNLAINGSTDNDTVNVEGNDILVAFAFGANGVAGTDVFDMEDWNVSGATGDGLAANNFDTVNIDSSAFNNNSGDGISLTNSGTVTMSGITANGNDPGIFMDGVAGNFSLSDATVSGNDDHGISLLDVTGDVTLIRVTADNNDADNDSDGDGFQVLDGGDVGTVAMGGNLLVRGSTFRDTDGAAAGVHQENGVYIQNVSGTVTFNDSVGPVLSNTVTGNEEVGVWIDDGGTTATFTNGTYSTNGLNGLRLESFSGAVSLTGVTASGNGTISLSNSGVFINEGAGSFSDTNGTYRNNARSGIYIEDLTGSVTLVRTTAEDNDSDDNTQGSGVEIVSTISSLLVQGGTFRDTTGAGGATHQEFGILVDAVTGAVTFQDAAGPLQSVTVTGNENDGVLIGDGGTTATFTNGTYSNNGGDGIDATSFSGDITMTGVTANNNVDDGIDLQGGDDVVFTNVTTNGNDPGTIIEDMATFTATDSSFSNNDQDGLLLIDITGNVTLVRVTADDNDFDGNDDGDGVHAIADDNAVAIGGNLLVQGGSFSDTGGAGQQDFGIRIASIAGSATFENSGADQVNANGNEFDGVAILNGGTNATFTNGTYNNNGDDGIDIDSFSGTVALSFVTATGNGDFGFEISNVTNGGNTGTVNLSDLTLTGNNGGGNGPGGDLNTIDIVNYTTSTGAPVDDTLVVEQTFIQRTIPFQQQITYTAVENMNLSTHDGDDTINVNGTGATVQTTVNGNNGDDTFNINASNLASPSNTFNGNDGDDTFNVNINTAAGVSQPISIHGNANDFGGGVGSRDRVNINENLGFGPVDATFTYTGNVGGSELTVTAPDFVNTITIDTAETVAYFGNVALDDTVNVVGTPGDDEITVAPLAPDSALVFLGGDPWDGPGEGDPFDQFPGVAGGSTAPDLYLNGIDQGTGLNIAGGGATPTGADRLFVYAQSEADLNDANTFDPFGFGAGVIIPGAATLGFGNAYNNIVVTEALVTIGADLNETTGATGTQLINVNITTADFAQQDITNFGLIVNAGFEALPGVDEANCGDGIDSQADDVTYAGSIPPPFAILMNGGAPEAGAPGVQPDEGDEFSSLATFAIVDVFSLKGQPPTIVFRTAPGLPGIAISSFECFGDISATIVNLIGDNNDATVDQTDNFVVSWADIDGDGEGTHEMVVSVNGSNPIPFNDVEFLNVFGFDQQQVSGGLDNPATVTDADDLDTLELTPYADNADNAGPGSGGHPPRGWGIAVSFDEGVPEGTDGPQADLIILHNSGNLTPTSSVSENIVVQPSGPDNGEIRVTNATDGSIIVVLQYINNTDITLIDDDGSVSDTDSVTLRGTDGVNPQTSGDETVVANFSNSGSFVPDEPIVVVRDSASGAILYRIRNLINFDNPTFDLLDGDDTITILGQGDDVASTVPANPITIGDLIFAYVDTQGAAPADSVLEVFADDGTTLIESDDDDGLPGVILSGSVVAGAVVPQPGNVYFNVSGFGGTAVSSYNLYQTVVDPAAAQQEVEANNTSATANAITAAMVVGAVPDTTAAVDDTDFYSFFAPAGSRIVVIMDESPDADGLATDANIAIIDTDGTTVLANGNNVAAGDPPRAGNAAGAVTVGAAGTYFVRVVEGNPGAGFDTGGEYRFVVLVLPAANARPEVEPNGTPALADSLTSGQFGTGVVAAGNNDFFVVNQAVSAQIVSPQLDGVVVLGGRGNDTLIMDNTSGLSTFQNGVTFHGAEGRDELRLVGLSGISGATYNVGPNPDEGEIIHTSGTAQQRVFFTGLEPIVDLVTGPVLTVNATNANNAINYTNDSDTSSAFGLAAASNTIARFRLAIPGSVNSTAVTDLTFGDTLRAIDFQPGTSTAFPRGTLFGIATDAAGTSAQVYTINTTSGAATAVGARFAVTASTGFGLDFNPTNLLLRITNDSNENFSFSPLTGVATPQTALTAGSDVVGSAYDRNDQDPATLTTLYGIDFTADTLVRQGDINGSPNGPGGGIITTIGALGFDTSAVVGFDIVDASTAYATLTVAGVSGLYSIDLATGAATFLGATAISLQGLTIGAPTGLVSIDAFETIEFANKTTLIINGLAGEDTININNPFTPNGLTTINVNAGDPTASDHVIVNVLTAATVNALTNNSATVTRTGEATVNVSNAELLTIVGDGTTTLTVEGAGRFVHTPGAVNDAGTVRLDSNLPVNYANLGVASTVTINGTGATDTLEVYGTNVSDTISVAAITGDVTVNSRVVLVRGTAGNAVENLVLRGLQGDDTFNLNAVIPYTTTLVDAGEPSASDVLNLIGTAGAEAILVDLGPATITGFGGTVSHLGVEHVRLDGGGGADTLTVNGTVSDDLLTYTPKSAPLGNINSGGGDFQLAGQNTRYSFDIRSIGTNPNLSAFTVDLSFGADQVVVNATTGRDTILIDAPNRRVSITPNVFAFTQRPVALSATTEGVKVNGLDGNDTFHVVPPAAGGNIDNLQIYVDGGSPHASDALVIGNPDGGDAGSDPDPFGATDFVVVSKSLDPNAGVVRVFRAAVATPDIVYNDIEVVSPNFSTVNPDTGEPNLLILGPDIYEANEFRATAAFLGAGEVVQILHASIFPNATEHPGVPADADYFRVVAETTGILDFQVYFRTYAAGLLPGNGDLSVAVLDSDGTVITGFGSNDANANERVRIPAVAGQTYYLRVTGADGTVVNGYDATIINTAPPVPFDIELDDNPPNGATNPPGQADNSDTGRSQFDNHTYDNTPTIFLRLDDGIFLHDLPGNPADNSPPDEVIDIPFSAAGAAGYRVAVFVENPLNGAETFAGFATFVGEGIYSFTFAALVDGSHFITARVQMVDPASPTETGFGDRSASLEIVVDTVAPPVFFGTAADPTDGVSPDDGVIPQPPFFIDNKINDQTPTFWGIAEANSIVRVYADNQLAGTVGTFDAADVQLGMTVALPYDGTNQYPNGFWTLVSVIDLNDPAFFSPVDGLRTIFVTAEDLAGNLNPGNPVNAQTLQIFLDTQGPQITGVFHTETLLVGLSGTNTLIRFRSDSPGEILGSATVTLAAGEILVGIDWRPATQELYGLVNSTGTDRLVKLNPFTGAITFTVNLSANLTGTDFGVDFNPVADALRVVSDTGANIRISPATGVVTPDANLNTGTTSATAAAYTNNTAGTTSTSLYVINTTTDQLFLQSPPNSGTTTLVGGLGVDATAINGFDIASGTNVAFAALTVGGNTNLYRINLTTGAATLVGDVDSNSNPSLNGLAALKPYDVFDPKPTADGPTPLVTSLSIRLQDLPARVAAFLNPAANPGVVIEPGHFLLVGDANGIIPIASVTFISDPIVVGQPATGTIVLTFFAPLPDDRFTLTVSDSIVDDAGNALDGESNASEPQETPSFPTGDGQPGGDFVARFTVDSRPELGVTAAGSIYVDTNGNFGFDPYNNDFVNRDITYVLGFTSDNTFAGNFVQAAGGVADGFDKIAAYGRVGGSYRWLIDTDNNGVPNFATTQVITPNGLPVAGNFDGNLTNGDEVGLYTGTSWVLDLNHDFIAETTISTSLVGLPIVGDFNGDGFDDLAVWSSDKFFIDFRTNYNTASAADLSFDFGFIGTREQPVAADFDKDGIDDLGLWVPDRSGAVPSEQAEWYLLISHNQSITARVTPAVGDPTRNVVNYTPTPFGHDVYALYGDDFALPLVGNFDPPIAQSTTTETGAAFKNGSNVYDVNDDGHITNIDAFLVISALRSGDRAELPRLPAGTVSGAPYVDVTGDNNLTNLDAFLVVSHLRTNGESEGEGEAMVARSVSSADPSEVASLAPSTVEPSSLVITSSSLMVGLVNESPVAARSSVSTESPEYAAAVDSALAEVVLAVTAASTGEFDDLALAVAEETKAEDTLDLLAAEWLAPKSWDAE